MASRERFKLYKIEENSSETIIEAIDTKINKSRSGNINATQSSIFPILSFLWSAKGGSPQWVILSLILTGAGLCRWATGYWSYSGFESPPMHGDFEAQRHWMELTIHLPMTQWYFHDLEWWGLDYPPLTAYHSWLLGKIGNYIQPKWFELYSSRGLDDVHLKIFMRATVLLSEYAVFVPATVMFGRRSCILHGLGTSESLVALAATVMQPSIMLIDHAHFQYNSVMLGLFVASMTCIMSNSIGWACIFFVAALSFKQMALYYSPIIFTYLLGRCVRSKRPILTFLYITSVTSLSFGVIFAPFILRAWSDNRHENILTWNGVRPHWPECRRMKPYTALCESLLQLQQIVRRIFPFERGLFEDKVANIWCAVHTFHKMHRYSRTALQNASLGLTLIGILPPSLIILFRPDKRLLLFASAASAWAFFLFSFQVHEKSVLLPLLPMTLLLFDEKGLLPTYRNWIAWANILACWTLYPLLKREQLQIPYFVLVLLWAWFMGVPSESLRADCSSDSWQSLLTHLLHGSFYALIMVWHLIEMTVTPPVGKPDLWTVINVLIGTVGFSICYVWCLFQLLYTLNKWSWQVKENIYHEKSKSKVQ